MSEDIPLTPNDELQSGMIDTGFAAQAAMRIIEHNAELKERLATDRMTGLANADAWKDRLSAVVEEFSTNEEVRTNETISVFVADLNGFKAVNDTLGHQAGDKLLQLVGNAFSQAFQRDTDIAAHGSRGNRSKQGIARLGGDEFAALTREARADTIYKQRNTSDSIQLQADRVNEILTNLLTGSEFEKFGIKLSVGGATYQDGDDADTLFARADLNMFTIKYNGKISDVSDEDREQLGKVIPLLERVGHRIEPWLRQAAAA